MAKNNLKATEKEKNLLSGLKWGFFGFLNQGIGIFTDKFARFFWEKEWNDFERYGDSSVSWDKKRARAAEKIHMFKSLPYKANHKNKLDEEQKYIQMAMAVANHFYMSGDVEAYKKLIAEIGRFMDHYDASDQDFLLYSQVWAEYLHAQASICCMEGNPSRGSLLNHQVSDIYQRNFNEIERNRYKHCAICSKIESLNPHEYYLIDAFHQESRNIEKDLDSKSNDIFDQAFPRDSEVCKQNPKTVEDRACGERLLNDYCSAKFEIYIIRCKIESYRKSPNIENLQNYIENARFYLDKREKKGIDYESSDLAIGYYEAYLNILRFRNGDGWGFLRSARDKYKECVNRINDLKNPYICYLRIPKGVHEGIANTLNEPRLEFAVAPSHHWRSYLKSIFLFAGCLLLVFGFFEWIIGLLLAYGWVENFEKYLKITFIFISLILVRKVAPVKGVGDFVSSWSSLITILMGVGVEVVMAFVLIFLSGVG